MEVAVRSILALAGLAAICLGSLAARSAPLSSGALAEYLALDDPSYGWVERGRGELLGTPYVELTLTSQVWQGRLWKHQLIIIRPIDPAEDAEHALLFIDGGKWRPELESAQGSPELTPLGRGLIAVANALRTPVAILKQVPHQPMFGGLTEDALIAYTFDQYLATRDPEWPALLPMVKAAVRAMDAVQDFALLAWGLPIDTFTVSGASKRGWTTWLVGATDPRVTGIAPIVFDMLNIPQQLQHQQRIWGEYSERLADYTGRGLPERLDTEAGQELLSIVDPYAYREALRQPKLIILATNDPYWPANALNRYWDGLRGRNYILYVPNAGHSPRGLTRVAGSLAAFHRHVAHGERLPDLRWQFRHDGGKLVLRISSDIRPVSVTAWVARSPDRDFRDARWRARRLSLPRIDGLPWEGGWDLQLPFQKSYEFELDIPGDGYAAVFAEATYARGDLAPLLFLSTIMRVVGAAGQ